MGWNAVETPADEKSEDGFSFRRLNSASTDRDHRGGLVLLVGCDAMGPGIKLGFAVHHELVKVMTVVQRDLHKPGAIGLTGHFVNVTIPFIEFADYGNHLGIRSEAIEIDRLGHLPGGKPVLASG